ncbi:hypothetical protein GCM10025865_28990 [Paraoerskovia sediminicola]|uniref:Uncharacterized protein n=1 Tax=Paraoerskovia sediminicola TaxID=1138587 RepID=A0ABM8G613_9CELL|nr:hypothetical protein GCM10025865_28990 [Paraoerskovia sediminicola]
MRVLRRKPVVHGQDRDPEPHRGLGAERLVLPRRSDHHPSPVHPHERRPAWPLGDVEAEPDAVVRHVPDGDPGHLRGREQVPRREAHDRAGSPVLHRQPREPGDRRTQLRVNRLDLHRAIVPDDGRPGRPRARG